MFHTVTSICKAIEKKSCEIIISIVLSAPKIANYTIILCNHGLLIYSLKISGNLVPSKSRIFIKRMKKCKKVTISSFNL